jgi:hypothetical protein
MNQMSSEGRLHLLPKASDKLQPSVGDDGLWHLMQTLHMIDVDLSILLNSVLGVDRHEVGGFGELINDHPNRVKLAGNQCQSHNEVHANVIPLPARNAQRLSQSSKLHIGGLDLSVGITLRHIVSGPALHTCPPELLPQVMIHLGTCRMNRVPQGLSFIQNLVL